MDQCVHVVTLLAVLNLQRLRAAGFVTGGTNLFGDRCAPRQPIRFHLITFIGNMSLTGTMAFLAVRFRRHMSGDAPLQHGNNVATRADACLPESRRGFALRRSSTMVPGFVFGSRRIVEWVPTQTVDEHYHDDRGE